MRFRGFKIQVALLVFLVVTGIGVGAQYLYQETWVISPLVDDLKGIPGISQVRLEKDDKRTGSRMLVALELDEDMPLAVVFERVYHTLLASGGDYVIQLKDSPSFALLELFQRIQIGLEEAIMTGEFTILETRIQSLADLAGASWELGLDRDFVYLSLTEGENSLRRVISRGSNEGKVILGIEGGVDS